LKILLLFGAAVRLLFDDRFERRPLCLYSNMAVVAEHASGDMTGNIHDGLIAGAARLPPAIDSFVVRSLRALPITDTELKLMAAAAIIGSTWSKLKQAHLCCQVEFGVWDERI
jgi:hypothetical protein